MVMNFRCMICTVRSISFGVMGLKRDCSRKRFMTCVVNSFDACSYLVNLKNKESIFNYIKRLRYVNFVIIKTKF